MIRNQQKIYRSRYTDDPMLELTKLFFNSFKIHFKIYRGKNGGSIDWDSWQRDRN